MGRARIWARAELSPLYGCPSRILSFRVVQSEGKASIMAKEYRSPGAGVDGGTQLKARQSSCGRPCWASGALALVLLGLQAACDA
jgi:hypothetical protein